MCGIYVQKFHVPARCRAGTGVGGRGDAVRLDELTDIAVAHPDFRDELLFEAKKAGYIV